MGEKRCLGCMERFPDKLKMCPYCGYVVDTPVENAVHMEPGTLLADRYIIGKVLGYGGFGVTYVGWDGKLRQKVAIKEYFPTEFSTRMPGKTMLTIFNDQKKKEQFESGLEKFIDEAKRLAKFQNTPGIVKILDAIEENDTAYIIMEYLDGETLTEMLDREGTIEEDKAVEMLMPVMKSLEVVHKTGIIHRDIAPDNIFITKSGDVKLIDFGASRYETTSHSRSITVIIKPGYSPEEQYRSRGDQGPHTDVYALAATLYKMVTGVVPPDALERRASCEEKRRDIIKLPHLLNKNISKNTENALMNALNVRIEDRTPDIKSFITELKADPPVKRRYGNIKKVDLYQWPLWIRIALPAAALLIVVGGIIALSSIVHIVPPSESIVPDGMVVVPDVEQLKLDEARETVESSELNFMVAGREESEYIEPEYVVLQSPSGETYLEKNEKVSIWISVPMSVTFGKVPYMIGSTEEEAIALLKEAGYSKYNKNDSYSDNYEEGIVFLQKPEAGTEAGSDEEISFTVSLGSKPFELPSVIGKDKDTAAEELKKLGLTVSFESVTDSSKKEDQVVSQSPEEGSLCKKGSKVVLTVVTHEDTVRVDDVTGKTSSEAESILKKSGFKVKTVEEYSDSIESGKVIKQTPEAGTSQEKGSQITIYVSKGKKPSAASTDTQKNTDTSKKNSDISTVSVANTKVSVANVQGKRGDQAQSELQTQGLKVSVNEEYSDTVEEGFVISQSPSAGTSVEKGRSVTLVVSKGSKPIIVTYDARGGYVSQSSSTVYAGAMYGSLPVPTRENYYFLGWYSSASGGIEITSSTEVTEKNNHKIYAHWIANNANILITWDGNGGYVGYRNNEPVETQGQYFTYNELFGQHGDLKLPWSNIGIFDGWYTERDGGIEITTDSVVTFTTDQTLYAHWRYDNTITASASAGSNAVYVLHDNNELEIFGTGKISNFLDSSFRSNVWRVEIHEGITNTGNLSFDEYNSLTELSLPDSLYCVGPGSFRNNISLKHIDIPYGVEVLDVGAFEGSGLTSISIPETVKRIDAQCFSDCKSLTRIIIPSSIEYIGRYAFSKWQPDQTIQFMISDPGSSWSEEWENSCYANIIWS
ncbi:MAG: PASTA domain-containing protein [Acutalibacteraceae bacterium]|nr:PASTA domain-containing protein [Acutalibacteraceae bacterium]